MRKRFVAFAVAMVVLLMMIEEIEASTNTNVDYTSVDYTNPVKILENVQSVSLGEHSGAVTKGGTLYMWGDNANGQLGMWGDDSPVPVKVLENVQTVQVGGNTIHPQHSGAITKDGTLYMWGRNDRGQIGDGTREDRGSPVKVLENVQAVRLERNYSGAITKDGDLYMWGSNYKGALGDGTWEDRNSPVKVLENVQTVSFGIDYNGAITKDGALYMWGDNFSGALGDGTDEDRNSPVKVLENVQSVSLGTKRSGAVTKDGTLYMWGYGTGDHKYIVGDVPEIIRHSYHSPVKVLENVQSVSLGTNHNGVVTRDGILFMWGWNEYGQVGNGTNGGYVSRPVKVLKNVQSVSLGWDHSGAVTKDGFLYMWGRNDRGQLGEGTRQHHCSPVKVLENVQKASLNYDYSGAIAEDGSLCIWGANPCVLEQPTEDSMPLIQKLTQKITFRTSAIKKGKVIYGTSFSLNAKTTGTGKLSYKSSNTKVLSVNAKGKVTVKGYGPAYIQIKVSRGEGYEAAVRKFKLTAVPGKGKVIKAEQENGAVQFKWKPEKTADGYEYATAYNQKFSGQSRKKTKKTGLVLTKYKTGTKKMFLKVRAYKKIGKKIYYGSWSRPRWVKLKKGRKTGQASYSIVG